MNKLLNNMSEREIWT